MSTLEGNELWKECVRWMVDIRDGVLLCRLLNELAPKCTEEKEVHRRQHMSETVWNLHHFFYSDLRHAVLKTLGLSQNSEVRPNSFSLGKTIGDVFLQHKDKFITYGLYCMGLSDPRARILEVEKNDHAIKAKINECTASVNDNQSKFQDLLC